MVRIWVAWRELVQMSANTVHARLMQLLEEAGAGAPAERGYICTWQDYARRGTMVEWHEHLPQYLDGPTVWTLRLSDDPRPEPPDDTDCSLDEWNAKVDALLQEMEQCGVPDETRRRGEGA